MPQVKMPDGAVVDMPDTLTPELATRLKALRNSTAAPERTTAQSAGRGLGLGTRDVLEGGGGILNAPLDMLGDVAQGVGRMTGFPKAGEAVKKAVTPTNVGTFASDLMGLPKPQTPGEQTMSNVRRGAVEIAAPFVNMGTVNAARQVPEIAKTVAGKAGQVLGKLPGVDLLKGTEAATARQSAAQATRAPLSKLASEANQGAVQASGQARQSESVAAQVQRNLDEAAKRGTVPDLHEQGTTVRGAYQAAMQQGIDARTEGTKGLYQAAEKAAEAREATGARIIVAPVADDLKNLMDKAENIPPLKAKLQTLLGAVEGRAPEVPTGTVGVGRVTSKMKKPAPPAPAEGLTYKQLDLANRYIKDIAYSADLEGYGSVVRNAALNASKKLDKAIVDFVPEHAQAAAEYRRLSAPMETLGTKYGKALTATRGGVGEDAYEVVAAQQLPDRLFGTRAGVEAMVDALAGGKEGAERVAAQQQVDRMVENWVLSKAAGRVGQDAAKTLDAPGIRATLGAMPDVASRVGQTFQSEAKMARMGVNAQSQADAAKLTATGLKNQQAKLQGLLKDADALSKAGSAKYQKQGFDEYVSAMRNMVKSGDLPPDKFKAALGLLDRAESLQAKTDLARKITYGVAGLAGVAGAAKVGVQLPGVF